MTAAMDIAPLLGVTTGVTALIGGGGKTTLLYTLTEELRRRGTVILTTSTHIQVPPDYPLLSGDDAASLAAALAAHGAVCAAGRSQKGKLAAPALSFETLASLADYVLMEADGSKRLPLKAHAPHEPVIPACAGTVVYVVGADGFGKPVAQVCHRPERYAALCGVPSSAPVTPAMAAQVLRAEGYDNGVVYINKVEDDAAAEEAAALAQLLRGRVVSGSLHHRTYRRLR